MGSLIYICCLALLFAAVPLGTSKEQLSSRECEDLGFTGLALCSDCNTFAEYVKDPGIFHKSFGYHTIQKINCAPRLLVGLE